MRVCIVFPRLRSQLHGLWPPLGIIQLGTILANNGYDVKLIDSSFDPSLSRTKDKIREFKPDIVGVSALTDIYENASDVIRFSKVLGCKTILGGPHATLLPRETLEGLDELDFVVIGEGEVTLLELVNAIREDRDVHAIDGMAFRRGGKVVVTEPRQPVGDLDSLPFPNRDLLDTVPIYLRGRALSVHTIRGCPYSCTFCHPTLKVLFGTKVRFRSPASVVSELQSLYLQYKIRDFLFVDDLFTVSKSWLRQLSSQLVNNGLAGKLRFSVNSRVDLFDEEIASLLKRMNCYYVLFGVESGSQEILDSCSKGITLEQTRRAFSLCKKYRIRTHAYIILGLPRETQTTLQETLALVSEISPTTLQVSIATPLVGTDLYRECQENGYLNLASYTGADYYSRRRESQPITLDHLNYDELLKTRTRLLRARRPQVILNNITEICKDFARERSLNKIVFRASFYALMKHYWG